jgi:hypothetical protein
VNFSRYRNGVVRYESVMALRTKLDDLGKMEGIAHAEKGCSLTDICGRVHVYEIL